MPEEVPGPGLMPLFAPLQMFMQGVGTLVSSTQSMVQSAANMTASNVQDVTQTIQRGHAQFLTGINQSLGMAEGIAKKPLVDIQQIGQGGQPPQYQQRAPAPLQGTIFSPVEAQTAPTLPSRGPEYHPLTEDQSNFREGGFTESPRGKDQPTQSSKIETLFL